jgi:hypothetical protein
MDYRIPRWAWIAWTLALSAAAQSLPHTPPVTPPPVVKSHPRLVFRPAEDRGLGRTVEEARRMYQADAYFQSVFGQALAPAESTTNPAMAAACWIVTGEDRFAVAAVRILTEQPITQSGSGSYSDVWAFALAWDWLYHHPALAGPLRQRVAARISARLQTELDQLDDTGMALWHGRNQAANGAMIAALALAGEPGQESSLPRANGHYIEALRALDYSEGWPEGPSYWIYNRALPYALAADCYLTATGSETAGPVAVREAMRKIGLWTIYQYGPNGVFEPYGDSAGSLRLGETGLWEASVDYFARLSRDPGVGAGAAFFRLRSPAPYGKRPNYWYSVLAYDPAVRPGGDYDPRHPELWMRAHLPQTMLFGRRSLGLAFLRGAWGDSDELFATFKAGDLMAHHDHYNAGHFSIQLGGLLAPLTGVYGASPYAGAYRLGYAIQTVASNSLLILAPGETSAALRALPGAAWTALSGGQRVISPTGFDCVNLEHFQRQVGQGQLERADITAFESVPGQGDYLAADITAAYNSTRFTEPGSEAKVALVTRQFLYLRREQAFVIFDRIDVTQPGFVPRFLLHSLSKPRTATESLLSGAQPADAILETTDRSVTIDGERASLTQRILLPERPRVLKVGGPHYSGYVEQSGSQVGGFRGANLEPDAGKGGASAKPKGLWRVEVEPAVPGKSHRFLNVLLPRLVSGQNHEPDVKLLQTSPAVVAARVGASVVVMARDRQPLLRVELKTDTELDCWVLDALPNGEYQFEGKKLRASAEGVLRLRWPRGRGVLIH